MSKNNIENDVKAGVDSFLPEKATDDPIQILKIDKKLYSSILISIITLTVIANLIAVIIGFISSTLLGVTAIFIGGITSAIIILLTFLFVSIAHNMSRTTKATMLMCEKMLDMKNVGKKKEDELNNNDDNKLEIDKLAKGSEGYSLNVAE